MKEIIIGFLAGYLSGHFGLGGGLITTPALRLWLGEPALIAVGTPLLVNIPTSIAGAFSYGRKGYVNWRLALILGPPGMIGATIGAAVTKFISGHLILLITAGVIFIISWRFILGREPVVGQARDLPLLPLLASGLLIGFLSGLLGLGGGFLLVPFLSMAAGLDIKTTFGTSLTVVGAITLPGALVHYLIGHVKPLLGLVLIAGVVPGALIGSRVAMSLPGFWLRRMFGFFLAIVAVYLGYFEIAAIAL